MRIRTMLLLCASVLLTERAAVAGWETAEECQSATDDAEYAADDLANAARMLSNCAASGDFDDDCSSEFYRASSAHSEYESAVSEVSSYCN
jgi:hypothetical protein